MPATSTTTTPTDALSQLAGTLDLSNARAKLSDEGPGLTDSQLENEYRRFLALHLAYPDADIVPCKLVDQIWHQHILDTHAYHADCEAIFGSYLHHFPYFGLRGKEDAQALTDAYADTLVRYRHAFGEPPEFTWIATDGSSCKRTACKPQKCR